MTGWEPVLREAVKTCGGAAPDLILLGRGEPGNEVSDDPDHLGIVGREQADWPVAAKHQPLGAERMQGDVEYGTEVGRLPLPPRAE